MLKKIRTYYFSLIILCLPAACFAQILESKARRLVQENECAKSIASNGNSDLLRIVRHEDFEDHVFELQTKVVGDIHKGVYVYKVENTGYFVLSPKEAISIASTGVRKLLIAVSSVTSKVYPLYGCTNAEKNFSDLIEDVKVSIHSTAEAESFALLRYSLVEDPERRRWILNFRQFKHEVEDGYFGHLPPKVADRRYTRWLEKNRNFEKVFRFGAFTRKKGDRYSASLTYFESERNGQTILKKENIIIFADGKYNVENIESPLAAR